MNRVRSGPLACLPRLMALLLAVAWQPLPSQAAPQVNIVVKSGPANRDQQVAYLDVAMTIAGVAAAAGAPLLSMPYVFSNVESAAKTLQVQRAEDASGALTLSGSDAPNGTSRNWIAARAVEGNLLVRYRVPIDNTPSAIGSGPPLGLRTEGSGFSGSGSAFLMSPSELRPFRMAVHFDLSELGPRAAAMTNFGDGDIDLTTPGPFGRLTQAFYMAGLLHRYPESNTGGGFSAAWLGSIPFDAPALMGWTQKLYQWYGVFFSADSTRPYRVFLRFNPINPGGGVALSGAFVATHDGKSTSADELKITLAHEMLHTQINGIGQWFSEGVATYYARLLPMRAGLMSPSQSLADLNALAGRYYTNALIAAPNAELGPRFWEDTRFRTLPYDRGSFYLAVVDGRIRKASSGRRSLDDVVLTLVDRNHQHLPVNEETWVELLTREYGASAKPEFDAMLAGATQLPESGGFGPCFQRVTKPLRRFELGFDSKILVDRGRIVRGVVPGSAAEKAGLRDGDEIVVPVALDNVQGNQARTITYEIRRDGRSLSVTYLPRGDTIEAYQWERVAGVPDTKCAY